MVPSTIDWHQIERKAKHKWDEASIFEADPDPSKPKYFLTVAYPYPNSPQHIGHGRTYTLGDVHARYRRMKGYNVLFPMAFHYTGTPILAMIKRMKSGDEDLMDTFTRIYMVPKDVLKTLDTPLAMASYFHQEIKQGMKEMGYSIDWRREFTTVDPQYSRFIEWQFKKLHERGFITRGSHPVGWCPNDGNPVGQHDTLGDVEPEIGEYTLIKFTDDGYRLPTATLRPETVFGVTNIWVNGHADYVKAIVDGEPWIVSTEAAAKLEYLGKKVSLDQRLKGKELVGRRALNPLTNSLVFILPASFVLAGSGSGLVMSVPAHAPYDMQAIIDLQGNKSLRAVYGLDQGVLNSLAPISVVISEGFGENPALELIKKVGIEDQADPKLQEITSELYAHEFKLGRMNERTGICTGLSVPMARERVKEYLISRGDGDGLPDIMNSPVYCRCGAKCVVKIFENQWFLNYGDPMWKDLARMAILRMKFLPEDIRPEFENVVAWLSEKACARKAGMGTPLPWDREWIIESLSDSVIYMAYYLLAKYINREHIPAEKLTDEVLDWVLLGLGDPSSTARSSGIDEHLLRAMRDEFTYFYPLDSRHSGRDLVPNHLTYMIFNHVGIFPEQYWVGQTVVNGSVLMEGKKMSKSFGNILPLRDAIRAHGADPLRLTIMSAAELLQDADVRLEQVQTVKERLEVIYEDAKTLAGSRKEEPVPPPSLPERCLVSRFQRRIARATEAMDKLRVREALHELIYLMDQDVRWFKRRAPKQIYSRGMGDVLEARIRALSPFCPHLCEELWEMIGREGFVATARWPEPDAGKIDHEAEEAEELVEGVLEDTWRILKVTKAEPKRVHYYASEDWKWLVHREVVSEAKGGKPDLGKIIRSCLQMAEVIAHKGELHQLVKALCEDVLGLSDWQRERREKLARLDEEQVLGQAAGFLEGELRAQVHVYREGSTGIYDPKDRARLSRPYRPGIYIE